MRRILATLGWTALALELSVVLAATAAEPGGRKLGTCGPPPRKNPERQTSAESMPPLPLPATPIRRSEPKAEPQAPLMIAKLEYGTTQDWNTDPGDVDNLMRTVRSELALWYGWKHWNVNELVATYKAGQKSSIPILYMSGHEAFVFTPEQRAAVRQYVLDGGTLLGDACCGRDEFTDSFQQEVGKMFPDRSFDLLEVDHPIYRAYHDYSKSPVVYQIWDRGAKVERAGPPQLLGMNVGCRTAVILTPYDMSCGWDGHTHNHGKRLIPEHAVKLGINLVSYVAATRQLGEAQSVAREVEAPVLRPREAVSMAMLRHQGDWNPDPNSVVQWLRHVRSDTSVSVQFDLKPVDAVAGQLAPYPFLYMTGHRDPRFSDAEVDALRRHLQAGGFLFVNNCCGRSAFDQKVRETVARVFPDAKLAAVPAEHPVYRAFFTVQSARDRQSGAARAPELEGITVKGRLVLVYSKNDMVTQLKQVSDPFGNGYDAESCRKLSVNILAYALQN
jgi:hypothetical protein